MFQYAMGRAIALRHRTTLRFDLQAITADALRSYGLPVWRIAGKPVSRTDVLRMRIVNKVSRKLFSSAPYYRHPVIFERDFSFDGNLLKRGVTVGCLAVGRAKSILTMQQAKFVPISHPRTKSAPIVELWSGRFLRQATGVSFFIFGVAITFGILRLFRNTEVVVLDTTSEPLIISLGRCTILVFLHFRMNLNGYKTTCACPIAQRLSVTTSREILPT